MKKAFLASLFAAVCLAGILAQASPEAARVEGRRYTVSSELGSERAQALLDRLEGLFDLYNGYFRFDEARMAGTLAVKEFASKEAFDAYLKTAAGETRNDFVYLHYRSPERRELLLFPKDEAEFPKSLAHQAFVQFLKAFVQNPPLWIRDGFAIYFESARYDPKAGTVAFPENLAWLETVKSLQSTGNLLPTDILLGLDAEGIRTSVEVFYPESWAFVSFLLNAGSGYDRLLWEGLATLGAEASLEDNQQAFLQRLEAWYGAAATDSALASYLESRKTFPELVSLGVDAYNKKDIDTATARFTAAAAMDASSYLPPYYLGLIAYGKGEYAAADAHYLRAIELGCDKATAKYALGLSALAQGNNDAAGAALAEAAALAPDRYQAKVEGLLARLKK